MNERDFDGGDAGAGPARAAPHGKCGHGAASALEQLLQEHGAVQRTGPASAPGFAHNGPMTDHKELAEAIRRACIEAALAAYEDAGIAGLCAEGRWEAAVSAMQSLDVKTITASTPDQPSLPPR